MTDVKVSIVTGDIMARAFYPVAIIGPITPDHAFSAIFPDLLGCNSAGDSAEDAFANAVEAVTEHLGLLAEEGDHIPAPSSLEEARAMVEADAQPGDGPVVALLLAPVEMPGRALRLNVTLDENLVQRIDAVTSNRSAFLADAARAELRRRAAG